MPGFVIRFALVAILAATLIPAVGAGQPAREALEPGRTFRYAVSLDLLVLEEGQAASEMARVVQTAHITFDSVRREQGSALVVLARLDRLTTVYSRRGEQFEFTWNRAEDAAPGGLEIIDAEPGAAPEPRDVFLAAQRALVATPFELRVDDAGAVTSVTGLTAEQIVLAGDADASMLGMFRPRLLAETLEPIWSAAGAGGDAGDGWSSERRVSLGPAGAIVLTTAWNPGAVGEDALTSQGVISASVVAPETTSPTQPRVRILNADGGAELAWLFDEAVLQTWTETFNLGTRWTLGDLEITLNQRSKRSVRLLE